MLVLKSPIEIIEELGKKIKAERLRQEKYTQKEFAQRAGIPLSTYKRIEQTGKIYLTSLSEYYQVITEVYCLSISRNLYS